MLRLKTLRLLAVVAALALLAMACNGEPAVEPTPDEPDVEEPEPEEPEEPDVDEPDEPEVGDGLVIGYILPQTGPLAFLGPPQIQAVELALEDINAAGGVLGQDVTLIEGDEAGDPDIARTTAESHVAAGVHAVVGAASSDMSLAFLDLLHDNQIVQCSASNTAPTFTDHEANAFYFRTAPPDHGQAPILAETIVGDGHARVALSARADDYGRGLLDLTSQELTDAGAEVLAEVIYDPEAATFDAEVGQLTAGDPDAVVVIGFDEGAQIVAGLIEAGYEPGQIYGADGMKSDDLAGLVNPDDPAVLDGMTGTAPGAALEFNQRLFERLPDENAIFGGQAYDCTVAIALAAEAAGSTDPTVFVDEMINVVSDGTECTSFEECKGLLEDGEDIDYNGPSGPIGWTAAGADPSFAAYEIWQIDAEGSTSQIGSAEAEL